MGSNSVLQPLKTFFFFDFFFVRLLIFLSEWHKKEAQIGQITGLPVLRLQTDDVKQSSSARSGPVENNIDWHT